MSLEDSREETAEGIKKSKQIVGPLYPIITEKGTMSILDGKTRKMMDPAWPEREIEITDPKQRILIPMHANYRRRVPKKEVQTQILVLANMLEEEGTPRIQVLPKLLELTPYKERHLRALLPAKYKHVERARAPRSKTAIRTGAAEIPISTVMTTTVSPPVQISNSSFRSPTTIPVPKAVCFHCHTDIETVLCPRCLIEIPLKELRKNQ